MERLKKLFQDPPRRYRTMPQWSWNTELTEERLTEQLEQFAEQKVGGLFPHARPGLTTAYISDRWFELWGHACREAQRLGLEMQIYDEFTCPGGEAGGHVVSEHPHLVQQTLNVKTVSDPRAVPHDAVAYARPGEPPQRLQDSDAAREAARQGSVYVFEARTPSVSPTGAGFPGPDLTKRETTDAFLASTHDRYFDWGGDWFGDTTRLMFCDEPQLTGHGGAPFSAHIEREFRLEHGYDLRDRIVEFWFTTQGSREVRHDYWQTVSRLFNDNFMCPIHDWCAEHGLEFTGHLIESWPSARSQPDDMASLRWMQAPGVDLLGFQFEASTPEENKGYLLILKELSSVVNQLGREWALAESTGGAGYGAAFDVFKPLEDYLLSLGINVMDPHLAHVSLAGRRKYDWPHTLSDHSPWWSYYHLQAEHVNRANAVLAQGREHNRVLLLHPVGTAWMHWEPGVNYRSMGEGDLRRIAESQLDTVLALHGAQVDYDLGDEFILEEFGGAEDGRLTVGERAYELVVIPEGMETMRPETLELLRDYLETGGTVLTVGEGPERINARPSGAPAALREELPERWRTVDSVSDLVERVRAALPPRLTDPDGAALPGELCWRRAVTEEGERVFYLCNPWSEPLTAEVRLEGRCAVEFDTASAETRVMNARREGGDIILSLDLPARGHALWVITDEQLPPAEPTPEPERTAVELEMAGIQRLSPNALFLDYCTLEAGGRRVEDVNTVIADDANWRLQGFEGSVSGSKQFKRNNIARPIPRDSDLTVSYRFVVDDEVAGDPSLRLGVERLYLYEAELNGQPIDQDAAERWFDPEARAVPVGDLVRPGENMLTLHAEPFHVLCEIMPVYLLGNFSLEPTERGFRAVAPCAPEHGDWTRQGMPFYHRKVRYRYAFRADAACEGLEVQLGEWAGAVADVSLGGEEAGVILHPPYSLRLDRPIAAGEHELSVDVIGNMRNFMGPHFVDGLPGIWSYRPAPEHGPPGEAYKKQPTGLMEPPKLWLLKA